LDDTGHVLDVTGCRCC